MRILGTELLEGLVFFFIGRSQKVTRGPAKNRKLPRDYSSVVDDIQWEVGGFADVFCRQDIVLDQLFQADEQRISRAGRKTLEG